MGRAPDGQRHLIQTAAQYLGKLGVTPVAWCGVAIETVANRDTAWDELSVLECSECISHQRQATTTFSP